MSAFYHTPQPRVGGSVFDVMLDFGARGNGADDTAALTAAFTAANARPGSTVLLGPRHHCTGPLPPLTATAVKLRGRGELGGSLLVDDSASGCNLLTLAGQYVEVEDMWVVGNRVMTQGTAVRVVAGAFRARLRNVLISQVYNAFEARDATLTRLWHVNIADTYGPYCFRAVGSGGGSFNHSITFRDCVVGQQFPLGLTGIGRVWAQSTAYAVGNVVKANGNLYQCAVAGTSAAAGGGPAGIPSSNPGLAHTTQIVDGAGTLRWVFAMPAAPAFCHDSYAHTFETVDCGVLQYDVGLLVVDSSGDGNPARPTFSRHHNLQIDHPFSFGVDLQAGASMHFSTLLAGSVLEGSGVRVGAGVSGNWSINPGSEIFGAARAGIVIEKGFGSLDGVQIGACSTAAANTRDCIEVAANVSDLTIKGCTGGRMFSSTSPATRHGLSIAAGCDRYVVMGNRFVGNQTSGILNTPGTSATRVVADNI